MENKNSKKKLSSLTCIYAIFTLAILLLASIIANIYFFHKSQTRIFDCNLGERIEIEFAEQDTTILANIVYPSNIVSGTTYDQHIWLKTGDIQAEYYVRAKAIYADYNIVNESIAVSVAPLDSWEIGTDNYYYLNTVINDWAEIEFIDSLTLPIIITDVRNNTIITIMFEFLPTNLDVETLWNMPLSTFQQQYT